MTRCCLVIMPSAEQMVTGECLPYDSDEDEAEVEFDDSLIMHSWWRLDNSRAVKFWSTTQVQMCFRPNGKLLTTYDHDGSWTCLGGAE